MSTVSAGAALQSEAASVSRPRTRAIAAVAALSIVTSLLIPTAYMAVFSGFRPYDDEGYFLVTIRDYLAGHPLFTQALPIYGPAYYEFMAAVFKLFGVSPDHDSAGLVTVAVWLATSLLTGVLALRLSRNPWIALTALLVAFRALTALASDPIQPAGLTSLLIACLALAASFRSSRPRLTAVLIGALVAALCLVKINVGVLAALAAGFAFAAGLSPRWRRVMLPAAALVMTAAPFVLTARLLGEPWVIEFAIVVSISAACVAIATIGAAPGSIARPHLAWAIAGFGLLSLASVTLALAGGTRLNDAWNAVVVLAAGFPTVFSVPLDIGAGFDAWALVSLAFALALLGPFRRVAVSVWTAGAARVAVALFTLASLLLLPTSLWLLALPLVWIAAVAPRDERGGVGAFARALLPALAVTESLQVYPVAGTQVSMAAFVLVPAAVIVMDDGLRQLRLTGTAVRSGFIAPAALAVTAAFVALTAVATAAVYQSGTPLGLPGAERLRLPAAQAVALRGTVGSIDARCTSFITYPGMNSFYVWTGQAPPVELSSEVWWLVLSSDQQARIVRQLEAKPGLCVVKNQSVIDFWAAGRTVPDRPLVRFIDAQFDAAATFGDYVLLVRGNRGPAEENVAP